MQQDKNNVIAPIDIAKDLKLVNEIYDSAYKTVNKHWFLLFDPEVLGKARENKQYELPPYTVNDLKEYAILASNVRAKLLDRAACLELELKDEDPDAAKKSLKLEKKLYRG